MGSLILIFTLSVNLEASEPLGQVDCKVPTDLVKISVKEPMNMGFYCSIGYSYQMGFCDNACSWAMQMMGSGMYHVS